MQAEQRRSSEFIAPHLLLQVLSSVIACMLLQFSFIFLAVPVLVALLPLPACFLPNADKEAARIYLRSVGAALLCALGIYAAGFGLLLWLLSGSMKFM